ncbi:MAG: response regulator transcription factor [Anaerolineales bacterium]|nr:response regulator transcription factor [Anaerolineales bacterium]
MNKTIKVILADDHQNILRSILSLFDHAEDIEVVATAENGEKAVKLLDTIRPDVLILDIDMPKLNGLQVLSRLNALELDVKPIIFSIYADPAIVRTAFKKGAHGYVLKNRAAADLIAAVQKVQEGETFLSEPIANTL